MPITIRDLMQRALLQEMSPTVSHAPTQETTPLSPVEEQQFQSWAVDNGIRDVDHPDSRYDYRGYWKAVASQQQDQRKEYADGPHFPDTYKQHGHNTFSTESQYSRGPQDGGNWLGEAFIPQGMNPESFRSLLDLSRRRR